MDLQKDASKIVSHIYPEYADIYTQIGWKMLPKIDRVYVNAKARNELGWNPKYNFKYALHCLKMKKDFRSKLSIEVGIKGYHSETFEEGPYPVK